jgi:hypothetical protein
MSYVAPPTAAGCEGSSEGPTAPAGRRTHQNDSVRSVTLARLLPLADLLRSALVSLQKGPATAEIGRYSGQTPLVDLGPELRDFGDPMAVLDSLDQLVSVDTSVADLAGAMGEEALVMLPYAPDWRWLLDRPDTPWYRSLKPNSCPHGKLLSFAMVNHIYPRVGIPNESASVRSGISWRRERYSPRKPQGQNRNATLGGPL